MNSIHTVAFEVEINPQSLQQLVVERELYPPYDFPVRQRLLESTQAWLSCRELITSLGISFRKKEPAEHPVSLK